MGSCWYICMSVLWKSVRYCSFFLERDNFVCFFGYITRHTSMSRYGSFRAKLPNNMTASMSLSFFAFFIIASDSSVMCLGIVIICPEHVY